MNERSRPRIVYRSPRRPVRYTSTFGLRELVANATLSRRSVP